MKVTCRTARLLPSRVLRVSILAALLVGCVRGRDLRDQQAHWLKENCISFALRADAGAKAVQRLQQLDVERFRVGNGRVHGGVDALEPCRTP
jgi:hypothetical protein